MAKQDCISVTWEVDDGYCGGSAPQYTLVYVSDIQDCDTVEAAVKLIEDEIENDFRNKANPTYDLEKIKNQVEEVWNQRQKE